jgi:transcriptional regulator with XRE-family HTH domain
MAATKQPKIKTVAEYISAQIGLCGKSQLEIARESGFDKPNVITMIKQGRTKLPMKKLGKFAKALEVDPVHLLRMCMSEYLPDTWEEMQKVIGQPVMTINEMEILEVVRQSNVINPRVRTDEDRIRILDAINSLKGDNAIK